jgi:hypothetical protein
MNVQVKYRLAGLRVRIYNGTIPCAVNVLLFGHPPDYVQHVTQKQPVFFLAVI